MTNLHQVHQDQVNNLHLLRSSGADAIAAKLQAMREKISLAENKYQREAGSVALLAISKTRSAAEIEAAVAAGQLAFGENYVQEALPKIEQVRAASLVWHYTGKMQTNKAKYLARHFAWVQTVTKQEHAQQLNKYRDPLLPPLNVCIEINVSGEESKAGIGSGGGVVLDEVVKLAQATRQLPHLKLRGLMAIPAPAHSFEAQLAAFQRLALLYQQLKNEYGFYDLDTLSMGMSDDFEAAIAAGSTMVRIGTAIFGKA
jgi:PLP dependent protein